MILLFAAEGGAFLPRKCRFPWEAVAELVGAA